MTDPTDPEYRLPSLSMASTVQSRKGVPMAEAGPYGRKTQREPAVKEVHVLWITAGLSCDGDSVSITAATQPSIEDIVLGAIPGLPKVHLHNPVLAYENGRRVHEVLVPGRRRPARAPFVLVDRGVDPQREDQERGLLGRPRHRQEDRPADHRPANGSTAWRPRRGPSWRPAPAPPTAAFTPWPATRPAAWAWPITSAGTGGRWRACRSSTCRAARCSRTTSRRRCSTCSTRRRAWRR